jgi:hypothetical protein
LQPKPPNARLSAAAELDLVVAEVNIPQAQRQRQDQPQRDGVESARAGRVGWWLLALAGVIVLAGALRLARLGDWPWHTDEYASFEETAVAVGERSEVDPASQLARLPRMIPLAYWPLHAGHVCFGCDEFAARLVPALCGVLAVLLVPVLLVGVMGRWPALVVGLLLAVWPEHVYQSQFHRFYMLASTLVALALVAGARTWSSRRPTYWAMLAGGVAVVGGLVHLLCLGLPLILAAGYLAGCWAGRQPVSRGVLFAYAAAMLAGLALYCGHARPLMQGWNAGELWGYSPARAVLALGLQLGWSMLLLCAVGVILTWREQSAFCAYWLVGVGGWLGSAVVLPRLLPYHPAYSFLFALPALVLAGSGVARLAELVRMRYSPVAAMAVLAVACLLELPVLVSDLTDGRRYDFRAAAVYIESRYQPADHLVSPSASVVRVYTQSKLPVEPISAVGLAGELERLASLPGRVWLIVPVSRTGLAAPVRQCLGELGFVYQTSFGQHRLDYHDYRVEVYLRRPVGRGPSGG